MVGECISVGHEAMNKIDINNEYTNMGISYRTVWSNSNHKNSVLDIS